MAYIQRNLTRRLEGIIKSFSAVYLSGARQCGKSTLIQNILSSDKVNYLTFDTNSLRMSAQKDPPLMELLFENFIATEIMKNTSTLSGNYFVSHFNPVRQDGNETDFVIENDKGESVAIEVKLSSTLNEKDFKNLELCRDTIGNKFKKGIVLYSGEELVPFGDKLWAMPVNYLWDAE